MPKTIHKTDTPVTLEGFQAVFKPSEYGYCLATVVDQATVDMLEKERTEVLKWAESKLKNPKRSSLKLPPWEEVSEGKYKIKFNWKEETKPPIVDTEGTPMTDVRTPLYSGSTVKLGFYQKPYVLPDKVTYGTSLKLVGIQVVTVSSEAGVDTGDLDLADVAELFGTTKGYKVMEPNVTPSDEVEEEDDF